MGAEEVVVRDLGELDGKTPLALRWNSLVIEYGAQGFMQTLDWARFKRYMGFNVLHLGLFVDGELSGGAIFYTSANNKGTGFLVAPDGPILPWHNEELAALCLKKLIDFARLKSAALSTMALRVAPRLTTKPAALADFAPAPLSITEHKTMYLPLNLPGEELLQRLKPKARYNIGLAQRHGVVVREASVLDSVLKFCAVMEQVAARNQYFVEPLEFFVALFETLCDSGMVRVFFAEHEGDVLGALLMISFGGRASYLAGGTTDCKRNLMGGYALQWAAIEAARQAGYSHYDFWGYDAMAIANPEHTYAGFSRFKSQFAGEPTEFIGTFDYYFMDQLADVIIRAMQEIPAENT